MGGPPLFSPRKAGKGRAVCGKIGEKAAKVLPYDEKRENQDYTEDLKKLLAHCLDGTPHSAELKKEPRFSTR